jgi:hypothetical protein
VELDLLPVVDDGRLTGTLSRDTVFRALVARVEESSPASEPRHHAPFPLPRAPHASEEPDAPSLPFNYIG